MPYKDKEKRREKNKARYEANKEKYIALAKEWCDANKDKVAARGRVYRLENRERLAARQKVYYKANREKIIAQNKAYRDANRENRAANKKARRASDPAFRAICNFRARLHKLGSKARAKSEAPRFELYFGCTPEQYIQHIEAQFIPGMSWDNYGDWEVDHILPLCLGTNEFEWVMLNYYTNLRPMWAADNAAKSDGLPDSFPPNFPYWEHFLQHFELAA